MIFFWAFILFAAIQCRYVFYTFMRTLSLQKSNTLPIHNRKLVSVIICARNEAPNLRKNLPAILSQRYGNESGIPLYEVIVVNDNSTDDTLDVLRQLSTQYPNLKTITAGKPHAAGLKGKKHALAAGVAHATGNWLLLTDADCVPASDSWLGMMVAPLAGSKEIVAGYGAYRSTSGLLNAFTRWETLHTFIQYSSYAIAGRPYMAVGRNLACTKDVLLRAQSSPVWNKTPSGDDDLLVSIAGNDSNTAIIADPDAFTYTDAKTSWWDWARQKQRHLSTGKYYKWPVKLSLAIYAITHALCWLLILVLGLMHNPLLFYAVVYMAFRCLIYWIVWAVMAHRLREKKLIYLFPLFDIGWMLYNFVFSPYITWKNKNTWT